MQVRPQKIRAEFVIRLERGENVFSALSQFCLEHDVVSASFEAIGAIEHSIVGYYDLTQKQYGKKDYPEAREVAAMTGNIALVDGTPFVHCHVVLSGIAPGTENTCVGGHLFDANVAVTLEIRLRAYQEPIERHMDESIGLKLLAL